jgi:hypothetical protein
LAELLATLRVLHYGLPFVIVSSHKVVHLLVEVGTYPELVVDDNLLETFNATVEGFHPPSGTHEPVPELVQYI